MPIQPIRRRAIGAPRASLLLLLATTAAAVTAAPSAAQDTTAARRRHGPGSVVRPVLEGALGGAALATAYVNGNGTGWLMDDEDAVRAAVATGVGAALAVFAVSTRIPGERADRPRLRLGIGAPTGAEHDLSLGLRTPVVRRLALEGAVLVRNSSSRRLAQETRCSSILGCSTGTYIVDERRTQSVAALARAALSVPTGSRVTPVLTVGVGPMATRFDTMLAAARRDGVLSTVGLALEFGRVSRWTVEAEARSAVPTWRGDGAGGPETPPELAVRLGRAFGYR